MRKWIIGVGSEGSDRVKDGISERKVRIESTETETQKEIYKRKKEEARQEVGVALIVHNEMGMNKIYKGVSV